jgi:hypothetical protein
MKIEKPTLAILAIYCIGATFSLGIPSAFNFYIPTYYICGFSTTISSNHIIIVATINRQHYAV